MHNSSLAILGDTGQFPAAQHLKMRGSVAFVGEHFAKFYSTTESEPTFVA